MSNFGFAFFAPFRGKSSQSEAERNHAEWWVRRVGKKSGQRLLAARSNPNNQTNYAHSDA
jgi:hypothetical protein